MSRPGLRTRITLGFSAAMAVVLLGLGTFVSWRTGADLLASVDAGLRSRADVLAAEVRARGADVPDVEARLIEADESFAQIADASGAIVRSNPIVAGTPLLPPDVLRRLGRSALFDRRIPGIDNVTRVLAVPLRHEGSRFVLLVGSSLQDRRDQVLQLDATLLGGGVVALGLIAFGGWLVVGAALSPVERMRETAAAVSALEPRQRLPVPRADDELAALARTLNEMLARLEASVDRERRLLDDASHELRTPVGVLRARLELALSAERPASELREAVRAALADAEHLSRLADDLLVLSRAREGALEIHREAVDPADVVTGVVEGHRPAAEAAGVALKVEARSGTALVDPLRLRQAVDDLLDNAIRHAGEGGRVDVLLEARDGRVRLEVRDTGPGFEPGILPRAFEPFVGAGSADGRARAGLGLSIVRAVAEAHGGSAHAENLPGAGAMVRVELATG